MESLSLNQERPNLVEVAKELKVVNPSITFMGMVSQGIWDEFIKFGEQVWIIVNKHIISVYEEKVR